MREPFDLPELHALPIPRCAPEHLGGLPTEYLATFTPPRLNRDQTSLICLGCGEVLFCGDGVLSLFRGATFTWGLAHGEGHCDHCGYPTRMYHRVDGKTGTFPLQYHPDELEPAERMPPQGGSAWKTKAREYVAALKSADLSDDAAFQALLNQGFVLLRLMDKDIAREFRMSRPTVTRWRNGTNAPHPAMRKPIYSWLAQRAQALNFPGRGNV